MPSKEYKRQWYLKNKERIAEQARLKYEENKESYKKRRMERYYRTRKLKGKTGAWNKGRKMSDEERVKLGMAHRKNPLSKKGYVHCFGTLEHRYIMEQALSRKLLPGEVVHHIDRNKSNNSIDNLIVCPDQKSHRLIHSRNLQTRHETEMFLDCYLLETSQ